MALAGKRIHIAHVTSKESARNSIRARCAWDSGSVSALVVSKLATRIHNGIIETDLFTKPTDKHQHLLSSSCHPHHLKKAIPFSLALRLRRIYSTDAKFKHRINELKTYLLARGYNNNS